MANEIYIMEAANLFCGDHDPANSKHLTLEELKLPDFEATYVDHMPGGARGPAIEIEVGMNKLQPTFKLKGFDMALQRQFGLGQQVVYRYTAYGVIREKRTARQFQAKAVMEGRLGRIAPDAFKKGEAMSHEYAINAITHYEMYFDGNEEWFWDVWTNTLRIGSVDQNGDMNRILNIPTG